MTWHFHSDACPKWCPVCSGAVDRLAVRRANRARLMAATEDNDPIWPSAVYGRPHRPLIPPDVDARFGAERKPTE